ncbi:MAG: hypothetical protein ACFFED_01435 [Candidatus Thorarchaeota archaeon]
MTGRIQELVEILKLSKESEHTELPDSLQELLTNFGYNNTSEINREMRIEIALEAISRGCEAEIVIQQLTWKDFEGFVARVLQENDYHCTESYRRRGNKLVEGMEIDVIGVKGRSILAIDAKMWGIRSGKTSAIKEAIKKQVIRTERLSHDLEKLSKKIPAMSPGIYTLIPIMATWLVEDVQIHEGVPVIPIFKLNAFLLDLARFEDFLISFEGNLNRQMQQSKL